MKTIRRAEPAAASFPAHGAGRRAKTALLAAAIGLTTLSGCGVWFGEEEVILPGERIALREEPRDQTRGANAEARIPQAASGAAEWPQAGGSPTRSIGHAPGNIALTELWSVDIGAASDTESRITASPVAAGGRVYALDAAATVTAISADSGREIWEADLTPEDEDGRDGFGGGMAVAGETLLVATGFGELVALSTTDGSRRWTATIGAPIRSAPAVARGTAVVATRDGSIVAVDLAGGAEKWRVAGYESGASMLSGGGSAPAISGQVVAAPFPSGDLGIMRLSDGRRGWTEPLGGTGRNSAMSLIADVSSSPVMSGGMIYAGGVSGQLAAFDIPTGRRIWSRDIGAYNPVWAAEQTIFVISEDAKLQALAAGNGVTVWETALPLYEDPEDQEGVVAYGGPVLAGGALFLTSSEGAVYKVDAVSGRIIGKAESIDSSTVPPIVANGVLYVVDDSGTLTAFR